MGFRKFIVGLGLGLGLLGVVSLPVLAISNPNSIEINEAFVFRNVLKMGDQLYFARYHVSYNITPDERPGEAFLMAVYDSGGLLVKARWLNYYGHNIISIYLEPSEALTWGVGNKIRILGSPTLFDPIVENVNMKTRTFSGGDYKEYSELGGIMLSQALELEGDLGALRTSSGERLNAAGTIYFLRAVPNLNQMVPTIFSAAYSSPSVNYTVWERSYEVSLQEKEGGKLKQAVTDIGGYFGVSEGWMGFWLASLAFLLLAGIVYPATGNPLFALVVGFPLFAGLAWLGVGTTLFQVMAVILLILAVIFGIYFILGRFR